MSRLVSCRGRGRGRPGPGWWRGSVAESWDGGADVAVGGMIVPVDGAGEEAFDQDYAWTVVRLLSQSTAG